MNTLIFLGLLAFVAAGVGGRVIRTYSKPMKMMMQQKSKSLPDSRCKHVGQFLTSGSQCTFLVCDYGNEPWKDKYGNVQLYTTEMPCAPGTYVKGSSGSSYKKTNPCNGRDDKMCLPQKSSKYTSYSSRMTTSSMSSTKKMEAMVEKQKTAISTMDADEVIKMVKALGEMLQNEMYTVRELMSSGGSSKMRVMKQEMMDMHEKMVEMPSMGYGGEETKMQEMKMMCYKMLDMMKAISEMKMKVQETSGYGRQSSSSMTTKWMPKNMQVTTKMMEQTGQSYQPMMMVMPMEVKPMKYMQVEQMQVDEHQGYGMTTEMKKMKMKEIVKMMEQIMEMMEETGYGSSQKMEEMQTKHTSGYGQTVPMEMQSSMSSYDDMKTQMNEMMSRYKKMEEMKKSREMMSGYGMAEEMQTKQMSGYGKMEEMREEAVKPVVYVLVPAAPVQEEMKPQTMKTMKTMSYWQ